MAEKSRIEVVDSILNHAPKDAVTWSADKFREFMEKVGYSGIAYLPIRSVLGWDILRGRDKGLVREIYQSYREVSILGAVGKAMGKVPSVRELRDANRAQGAKGMLRLGAMPIFDLGMNLDMPHMNRSNQVAARVQSRLERKVPYLAHPYGQVLGDALSDPSHQPDPRPDYRKLRESDTFADIRWQPTVELMVHRGTLSKKNPIKTVQNTIEIMQKDGFGNKDGTGKVDFDINHLLATRQGRQLDRSDVIEMGEYLAATGLMGSCEYSAQPRLGGDGSVVYKTLDGNIGSTPHGEIIAAVAGNTPPDQTFELKVEVPAYVFGDMGMHYQRGHELLVPILQSYTHEHLQTS